MNVFHRRLVPQAHAKADAEGRSQTPDNGGPAGPGASDDPQAMTAPDLHEAAGDQQPVEPP